MEEEADETQYWLEVLEESNLIDSDRIEAIKKEVNEIVSIVVASVKTARENENRKSINQKL